MTARHDADDFDPAAEIIVHSGNPDPGESAAVVAVVATAIEELRAEGEAPLPSRRSAWELQRRGLRAPLRRGLWRSFSG